MKRSLIAALFGALLVCGCGLKTGLEQPPPQWGKARAEYEAQKKAEAEAAEKAKQKKAEETATQR
jgi:hypothetical protein